MRGQPIWGLSVWAGVVCALIAVSSLFHGSLDATGVLLAGAVLLFAWAAWLHHGEH